MFNASTFLKQTANKTGVFIFLNKKSLHFEPSNPWNFLDNESRVDQQGEVMRPSSPSSFVCSGQGLGALYFSAPFRSLLFVFFPLVSLVPLLVCGWTQADATGGGSCFKRVYFDLATQHNTARR